MNKALHTTRTALAAGVLTVLTVAAGCKLPGGTDYYEVEVPRDRVRNIENLELPTAGPADGNDAAQAPASADANITAPAQLELTLEDARTLALQNNLDLKVQLMNPAIADQRVSEEEARFEAAMFSNIRYSKTDTPTSSLLSGSSVDASSADLGVRVPLRTGGTLTFDVAESRVKTNNIFSTLNPAYDADASISLSQPLLRGAGVRANTHAIRIASYDRQITDARTKLEIINVLAAADRLYWRLYAARRQLEVRRQQYDLAQAQLEQAVRFVDSGRRSQIEVVRAEAGVAQRLEAIITAENDLRDRQRELKRAMNRAGLDMSTSTILVPATEPVPIRYELDPNSLVAQAMDNRMELLELEVQLAQDISTIDYLTNQALPQATLDYTYNLNGLGGTRRDAYDLMFDNRFSDHRFGLQVLVPLGNQAAESRVRQAWFARRQRIASRQSREKLIELEVLNAIDQVEANWQRILAGRQRTILDGRLYEAEKRQFSLGLNTTNDVLEAQTNYADAQTAEILALTEYQIALVDLAYSTGTLLGKARIHWDPITPSESQ